MSNFELAAPLAAALAAKGYETLTAVQQAVLADGAKGRDLLVSAQTGSGKTVAFGLAMADEVLAGDALPVAAAPLALAIAPTRELALQVARELAWLYDGAQIATCVGGMDFRNEKRALDRGAQIVVGTPGRLRDHIDRGTLDLSALRVAVLDEADEMLDLGFREDLEFILTAAPDTRRTLMFSATVPPAIEALARDFQNDALRLAAQGEARQHGDIAYRALSVLPRDREPAIFNLLRFYDARTAIVFCKTRANVSHLLARMGNRGFKAVALSGELSQQERNHALQALRDGRARVCVATDVAARGIDLPGLELVIHADLPTNAETLLHRSGRTGRAGAKGVSALIVTSSEYKKAQRLLHHAKVTAEWGKAPSADDVRAQDHARMLESPVLTAPVDADDAAAAPALIEQFGADRVAAAFIRLWREGQPAPEELAEAAPVPAARAPRPAGDFGPSVWFTLSVGHTGRAEARWLLPKICEAGGIDKNAIGMIRVKHDVTFVQIAEPMAPRFGEGMTLEEGLEMRRMAGAPDFSAPAGPRPGPRPGPHPGAAPRKPRAPREGRDDRPAPPRKGWAPRDDAPEGFAPRPKGDRPAKPARPGKPFKAGKPGKPGKPAAKFARPAKPGKPFKGGKGPRQG